MLIIYFQQSRVTQSMHTIKLITVYGSDTDVMSSQELGFEKKIS